MELDVELQLQKQTQKYHQGMLQTTKQSWYCNNLLTRSAETFVVNNSTTETAVVWCHTTSTGTQPLFHMDIIRQHWLTGKLSHTRLSGINSFDSVATILREKLLKLDSGLVSLNALIATLVTTRTHGRTAFRVHHAVSMHIHNLLSVYIRHAAITTVISVACISMPHNHSITDGV